MTPTLLWVLLLALVGRAASVPRPLVPDACALLCNPGAETESERERDPVLFPRYPKVNCKLQSSKDDDQAWIIASHCLKLCGNELDIPMEVNCFALLSSLQSNIGCNCEAMTPLSPNTMRLHESWRLKFLVKEVAHDILNVILSSPLDTLILCEIHDELFNKSGVELGTEGQLVKKCASVATESQNENREKRETKEKEKEEVMMEIDPLDMPRAEKLTMIKYDENEWGPDTEETETEKTETEKTTENPHEHYESVVKDEVYHKMLTEDERPRQKSHSLTDLEHPEDTNNQTKDLNGFELVFDDWLRACKQICKYKSGNQFCNCDNPDLRT